MNENDETQIRARLDAASKGPWKVRKHPDRAGAVTIYAPEGGGYVIHPNLGYVNDEADAAFMAAAREDIATLLAEIDRLRAQGVSA